jgi:hypothetical protein
LPGTQEANRGQGYGSGGSFDAIGNATASSDGGVVNRLVCEDCGTVYYSAAAKTLAEQGQTCAKCGGRLLYEDDDGPGPVALASPPPGNGDPDDG